MAVSDPKRRWRDKNRDKYNAYMREWMHRQTPEKKAQRLAQTREWSKANRAKRRTYALTYARRANYGLTDEAYAKLLSEHPECPICLATFDDKKKPNVDHCHKSRAIRGILCGQCNSAVGMLKDDPANGERLAAYLRRPFPVIDAPRYKRRINAVKHPNLDQPQLP